MVLCRLCGWLYGASVMIVCFNILVGGALGEQQILDRARALIIEYIECWLVALGSHLVVYAREYRNHTATLSDFHWSRHNCINFVNISNKNVIHTFVSLCWESSI